MLGFGIGIGDGGGGGGRGERGGEPKLLSIETLLR
jgi:hypothetical protein